MPRCDGVAVLGRCAGGALLAAALGCSGGGAPGPASAPLQPPAITTHPLSQQVDAGRPANFTVAATGTPPLAFEWAKNGATLAEATTTTLSFSAVAAQDAGSYTVTVSNAAGRATSQPAVLTVRPASPAPVDKPRGLFASAPASDIYAHPQLRGVLVRMHWNELESTPGSFDLARLDQLIAGVKRNGRSWSLAVGAGGPGSPAWLMDQLGARWVDYKFRGTTPYRLPLFWLPVVQERLALLAQRLGQAYGQDPDLKLVYIPQMTANGLEGHLQGVDMNLLRQAGYTDDVWVQAAGQTARAFAAAFPSKALAFEVHEVNGGVSVPDRILRDLWDDPALGQRVGAAMWWISGKTSYQPGLLQVLQDYPGDIYGQSIGRSDESDRFEGGDYRSLFLQAKLLGLRYLEPWEYEFKIGPNTANGAWDATFKDFNDWVDATFGR